MELEIAIEIRDPELIRDLFESTEFSEPPKKTITEGVYIQLRSYTAREALDFPTIVNVTAYIAEHVALPMAVAVLSRYLYDKLKDRRNSKTTINQIPVEINAEKIEKLIVEILKNQES
jgi:hypothetical protein